jgi:hypothetical protein
MRDDSGINSDHEVLFTLMGSGIWKDVRSTLFPPIKDDELDLVISADPKTLYNPLSKTFSVR